MRVCVVWVWVDEWVCGLGWMDWCACCVRRHQQRSAAASTHMQRLYRGKKVLGWVSGMWVDE